MLVLALVSSAFAAPPGWTVVPFGVGVYVHGKPVRGAVYSVTQAAGIALGSVATVNAYAAADAEDDDAFAQWQTAGIAGITLASASYLASVIDGSRLHELEPESQAARASVVAWDVARARGSALVDGGR